MAGKIEKGAREVTITGFIEEIEIEDGEMGLQVDDGDHTYLVVMDKVGSKLQRYVDEEVDLTGLVTKTGNQREFKVVSFRLAEDYSDEDDASYDDDGYLDDGDDFLDDRNRY